MTQNKVQMVIVRPRPWKVLSNCCFLPTFSQAPSQLLAEASTPGRGCSVLPAFPFWMLICALSPNEGQDPQGQGLCIKKLQYTRPSFICFFSRYSLHMPDRVQVAENQAAGLLSA